MKGHNIVSAKPSLGHFCGVAGIISREKINIPQRLFYALFSLQHRGQESAGISYRTHDQLVVYKDLGKVSDVLTRYLEEEHPSNIGIGHVRYSTHGGNRIENAQPIMVNCNKGNISLAHNGNISNAEQLKQKLVDEGSIFETTSDTELVLHMIARSRQATLYDALKETLKKLEGGFSMVMIHEDTLITMRDPNGFRPLYIGRKDDTYVVVSETCAMDILEVTDYRSVEPGELITIRNGELKSEFFKPSVKNGQCVFELIYFARPDSMVFDKSVHEMRKRMGAALAKEESIAADMVIPVPDSGTIAAIGYSEASGLPMDFGLSRNHHAGRSFILPTTAQREFAVRMKLHPVKCAIEGKRIILIDDSLVRGTTSRAIVKLLKDSGAKEIHLRLSSPEIKWSCYFGIDTPTREELISNSLNSNEIAEHIGADSVRFLSIKSLQECIKNYQEFCFGCFSGRYPIDVTNGDSQCQ